MLDVFRSIEHDRPLYRIKIPTSLTNEMATMVGEKVTKSLQQSEDGCYFIGDNFDISANFSFYR